MNFLELEGNDYLKQSLNSLEKQERMPYAIIISGGNERSRKALAVHLSMWAVCDSENKPCGKCKNCINAQAEAHSDIYIAKGEGKTDSFSKDEIKKIIRDSFIKPNQANKKVYIFNECDRRFPEISQNVFLKTLEEPPQDVLFIMTCQNSNIFLETICSRASVFSLEHQTEINSEALETAKEIALGIVAPSEMDLLKATYKLDDRQKSFEILDLVSLLLRDGLAMYSGGSANTDKTIAQSLCKKLTKAQYIKLIETTHSAETKIAQNAGLKLIATWLCGEYRRIAWQR